MFRSLAARRELFVRMANGTLHQDTTILSRFSTSTLPAGASFWHHAPDGLRCLWSPKWLLLRDSIRRLPRYVGLSCRTATPLRCVIFAAHGARKNNVRSPLAPVTFAITVVPLLSCQRFQANSGSLVQGYLLCISKKKNGGHIVDENVVCCVNIISHRQVFVGLFSFPQELAIAFVISPVVLLPSGSLRVFPLCIACCFCVICLILLPPEAACVSAPLGIACCFVGDVLPISSVFDFPSGRTLLSRSRVCFTRVPLMFLIFVWQRSGVSRAPPSSL